jgi:hypothetical protein
MLFHTPYLTFVGAFFSAVVVFVGLLRFDLLRREMKVLLAYFFFVLLVNLLSLFFSVKVESNLWLYHFITLIEFTVFVLVFSSWLDSQSSKYAVRLLIPLFCCVWFALKLSIEDLRYFDNFSSSLKGLLLVGIASYVLFALFKGDWEKPGRDFRFWVLFAVLIYHTVDVMFASVSNVALSISQPEIAGLWSVHWFIGIVANVLYVIAFLVLQPHLRPHQTASGRHTHIHFR